MSEIHIDWKILAQSAARHLGDGWIAEYDAERSHGAGLIRTADQFRLWMHAGKNPGAINVRIAPDWQTEDHRRFFEMFPSYKTDRPAIDMNVSGTKAAKQIAADITRRLIDPWAGPWAEFRATLADEAAREARLVQAANDVHRAIYGRPWTPNQYHGRRPTASISINLPEAFMGSIELSCYRAQGGQITAQVHEVRVPADRIADLRAFVASLQPPSAD